MSLQITCPLPNEISAVANVDCEEHFGQIVRVAFARASQPIFTDETTFATEVAWDLALAKTDSTKAVFSPLFNNFVIPEGGAATIGPDTNETLFGELKVVGKTAITCTGRFQGLPFATKEQLEEYISEGSVFGNLGVFLIDEFNKVYGLQPNGAATAVQSIPISSFFIGDPGTEGYNTLTYTPFQFNLKSDWVANVISVTPDFDAILKLNP